VVLKKIGFLLQILDFNYKLHVRFNRRFARGDTDRAVSATAARHSCPAEPANAGTRSWKSLRLGSLAQRWTCSRNFENRQEQISDRSRKNLQVLRLINDSDAIDLSNISASR
jgi:hypothetical protein